VDGAIAIVQVVFDVQLQVAASAHVEVVGLPASALPGAEPVLVLAGLPDVSVPPGPAAA
jgi:hypothetical protein